MKLIEFADLKPRKGITFHRVHLMKLVKKGAFPTPVPVSDRRIAWIEEEIDDWLTGRAALRNVKKAA